MKCIRCLRDEAECVATAPDGSGDWELFVCSHCNFGWRSSEPKELLDPALRRPEFQLEQVDLDTLQSPCPIPPLTR